MNTSKKINVNFSSLVGLKAELLRKQTEVNEAKLKSEINYTVPIVKKKPKIVKEKSTEKNIEKTEYIEDTNTHKKSKLMLEAKARLYERLKKSKNSNDNFLVDFTNKSDESEEESLLKDDKDDDASLKNEDDWVEYEDCFGRTRKCLREDLPLMQEKDNLIKQQIINKKGIDPKTNDNIEQTFVEEEKEPEIEIMRRKWEEQTKKLIDKVDIHYQDVLFDEARAHGVGYYAFSQDEEERTKQQENLSNLRKETERKQREIKELKELREKMENNRLKAARIRQRVRAGLPIEPEEDSIKVKEENELSLNASEISNKEQTTEVTNENCIETEKSEEEKTIEKENKIRALGELLGKRNHWYEMSQEEWIHKCRKVRLSEFGPVYDNFKSSGYLIPDNNDHKFDRSETIIQTELQSKNDRNTNTYDIPLPSTLLKSNANTEDITLPQTDSTTQYDSVVANITLNDIQKQMKFNKSIDEESIAAGLRYLREKFEESQNT
ncbi:PREDICTED: coiled-coil domain-containing protein 174 [Dufourea novaeangliae]|uniref:coiled-coil domain-containing protein 174 n=1 Tax=Dufourea novaeangliae TaxID=178035 RepID=UPI00076732D3|nr:PREDICTED: coiled-coil domain-containing protein 174 [Dufourea novaeangliae]